VSSDGKRTRRRGAAAAVVAASLALVASGCSSSNSGSSSNGSAGTAASADKPSTVKIDLTSQGCEPKPTKVPAGPVQFTVTNSGAGGVSEAELRTSDLAHILGEQENLTPGLSGGFSLTIQPGTYKINCPGASQSHWTFTVTGKAAGPSWQSNPQLVTAVDGYAAYVKQNTADLVSHTQAFCQAINAKDMNQARVLYPQARVYYERIEPVAEVAFHAVRNLARIGMGVVAHNWMELGFGRTSTTSTAQATPRNLLGFKDGTRNIKAEQTDLLNRHVWVGQETDQPWLRGGSYMVSRKIRMFVENWDRDYLADQENVIGRAKVSGAPLSGGSEFSTPDFAKAGGDGQPAIPADAHIRLASPEHNGGTHILRRGYSFTDGIDPQAGTLLGGLFFIAFMKNPSQFVKLQTALAGDALNEYIHHTGSAVFAVPPGLRPGQHYGDALFA
jgi:Dyp-type peroxidase, C-terminal/Imelysin/Cupredoxin-like domain